jgi:hypothetical protein
LLAQSLSLQVTAFDGVVALEQLDLTRATLGVPSGQCSMGL